jgi:hypothetical protein
MSAYIYRPKNSMTIDEYKSELAKWGSFFPAEWLLFVDVNPAGWEYPEVSAYVDVYGGEIGMSDLDEFGLVKLLAISRKWDGCTHTRYTEAFDYMHICEVEDFARLLPPMLILASHVADLNMAKHNEAGWLPNCHERWLDISPYELIEIAPDLIALPEAVKEVTA